MRLSTAIEIFRKVNNWYEVLSHKLGTPGRRLSLFSTRTGVEVILRRQAQDWDIFREIFLRNGYQHSLAYLAALPGESIVLDLGGNIGCFSLRATSLNPGIRAYSYEPGPPNLRIFHLNLLANPDLAERIELHSEAVAGHDAEAQWTFNEENAGGSSLYAGSSAGATWVTVRAFRQIVESIAGPISLAKIDIEGAEYELIRETPAETWQRIAAFTIELHEDPARQWVPADARRYFTDLGYHCSEDDECALFFQRR